MSRGVPILDTVTLPCTVQQRSKQSFSIILTQGLNRQIRRMCEYLGYDVVTLKRNRIMHIRLAGLKPGQWRLLEDIEIKMLEQQLLNSSKTVNSASTVNSFED